MFLIRWSASSKASIGNLRKAPLLSVILGNLITEYEHSNGQNKMKQIDTIKSHLYDITSRNFLLLAFFLLDLQTIFTMHSVKYQQSAGIIVGKEDDRNNLMNDMDDLKIQNGAHLNTFLSKLTCTKDALDTNWKKCDTIVAVKNAFLVRYTNADATPADLTIIELNSKTDE